MQILQKVKANLGCEYTITILCVFVYMSKLFIHRLIDVCTFYLFAVFI